MTKDIMLYVIDDNYGKGVPQVKAISAKECPTMYVIDFANTHRWFGYRMRINKGSSLICLAPQDALGVYVDRQEGLVQAGEQATVRLTMAQVLLWKLDNETSEKPEPIW